MKLQKTVVTRPTLQEARDTRENIVDKIMAEAKGAVRVERQNEKVRIFGSTFAKEIRASVAWK